MFTKLLDALKATRRTIVFTEGPDARILEATDRLLKEDLMDVILIGNADEVKAAAEKGGFCICKATIIDPATYEGMDEMVAKMVELRKGKMTEEECRAALAKGNYFGTMLVKMGKADALLGGATYSTADTVRPALQLVKTKKGAHLVSSSFILFRKDKDGNAVMKEWWNVTDEDIDAMLKATDWCPADLGYFRGGGYSSHFKTQAVMPMTMIRVNIIKGLGPVLQIAEGYTATLPDEIHNKLDMRTDPTWPTTWFAPRLTGKGAFKDVYSVMANWGANHGAISYGHIGADLITLCSMLRIPVAMHNVPEKDIFRPAAWNAFGMDKEGQDFRACNAYGPMYRNIR